MKRDRFFHTLALVQLIVVMAASFVIITVVRLRNIDMSETRLFVEYLSLWIALLVSLVTSYAVWRASE